MNLESIMLREINQREKDKYCILLLIQFSLVAQSCLTLCDSMDCSMPGFSVHHQILKLMSIKSVMPSNHLILCHLLPLLPSLLPSIRVFSSKSALCTRWPKYWSFRFSISPSSEYSGLICFRMDWFALLAVQRTPSLAWGFCLYGCSYLQVWYLFQDKRRSCGETWFRKGVSLSILTSFYTLLANCSYK